LYFVPNKRPAIEARRRASAGGHFVSSLIGIERVGEKNGGTNANQERDKERHVDVRPFWVGNL
jgi:hypothetical protein